MRLTASETADLNNVNDYESTYYDILADEFMLIYSMLMYSACVGYADPQMQYICTTLLHFI